MKQVLIIPLHSYVSVITNSSTVIYTGVTDNAVNAVKGIINEVLRAADSDKTVDDLYEITVESRDGIKEELLAREDVEEYSEEYWELYEEVDEKLSNRTPQVDALYFDDSVYVGGIITVKSKVDNPQTTTISDLLSKIFSVKQEYG